MVVSGGCEEEGTGGPIQITVRRRTHRFLVIDSTDIILDHI